MWGVWNSSQVPILTFEFSSRWPHHLMPLNCFSASCFLHSSPSVPPLLLYRSFFSLFPLLPPPHPELRLRPPCLPSLLHISLSTLPRFCPSFLLSFAPSFPGEWQAHKCSNDSGGGVSVTAIAAVTGARLSLGANTASASLASLAMMRDGEGGRKREKWLQSPFHPNKTIYQVCQPSKQSPLLWLIRFLLPNIV